MWNWGQEGHSHTHTHTYGGKQCICQGKDRDAISTVILTTGIMKWPKWGITTHTHTLSLSLRHAHTCTHTRTHTHTHTHTHTYILTHSYTECTDSPLSWVTEHDSAPKVVCVCVCVFLHMWGPKPGFSLTLWGPTIFVGTKSWTPQL